MHQKITLISNEHCWIEDVALAQLKSISQLPDVTRVVGLPDLHAGRVPVGIAVETEGMIYPHLLGNDVGCGMSLFRSGIPLKKYKQERFVKRLSDLPDLKELALEQMDDSDKLTCGFGTIGGGNHFAEFQAVEKIWNPDLWNPMNIDKSEILLLVHSGSRYFGQQIWEQFASTKAIAANSELGALYLKKQAEAQDWATRSRAAIASKLVASLGYFSTPQCLLDCRHNEIELKSDRLIHRKGSVSTERGLVVIPGSRGTLTYLVSPTQNTKDSLYSLSHGAGRKWARSMCKTRLKNKYNSVTIRETRWKSRVICPDTELLYQEAPEVYKNIEQIIKALCECGLIQVVATLRPLITFKA